MNYNVHLSMFSFLNVSSIHMRLQANLFKNFNATTDFRLSPPKKEKEKKK